MENDSVKEVVIQEPTETDLIKSENLKAETEQVIEKESDETGVEISLNPCQGYKVDPETKLHLCNSCGYHQHRNRTRPWVK